MTRDSLGSCSSKSPAGSREATEDVISFKTSEALPSMPSRPAEPEPTVPLANVTARRRERRGLRKGALGGGALRGGAKRITKAEAEVTASLGDISEAQETCIAEVNHHLAPCPIYFVPCKAALGDQPC